MLICFNSELRMCYIFNKLFFIYKTDNLTNKINISLMTTYFPSSLLPHYLSDLKTYYVCYKQSTMEIAPLTQT